VCTLPSSCSPGSAIKVTAPGNFDNRIC
jgi:hypothetical protein